MRREHKIGLFFTGALVILAVFIFIVGNLANLFRRPGYPIVIRYESSLGLDKTAAVKMAGIKIGYVKDIQLEGRRSKVILSIYPKYRIPRGSKAVQSVQGLLGEKYVDVQPSMEDEFLNPGDELIPGMSAGMDQLTPMLNSLGNDLQQVAKNLRDLTDKENRDNLARTIRNLTEATEDIKTFLAQNKDKAGQTLSSASTTFKSVDERVRDVTRDFDATLEEVRGILTDNRGDVRDSVTKIKQVLDELEQSVSSLKKSLEKIEKGEGSVGKLVNDESLYNESRKAIQGVQSISDSLSSLRFHADVRGQYMARTEDFKGSLNLSLWYKGRSFVLGQIVSDPVRDRFTYSLQGGLRWKNLAPRAGIIESEFGAGVDYYAFNDRLILSAEGLDFNRATSPLFRAFARFYPHKNVYLIVGLEDFSLKANRQVFFGLGAGI